VSHHTLLSQTVCGSEPGAAADESNSEAKAHSSNSNALLLAVQVLVDTERDGHRVSFNDAFKQKGHQLGHLGDTELTVSGGFQFAAAQPRRVSHHSMHTAQQTLARGGMPLCVTKKSPRLRGLYSEQVHTIKPAWLAANGLGHCTKQHTPAVLCCAALCCAGLDHTWGVELYGELLEIGGGKERMTKYFKVGRVIQSER
jgi:hypothetical protein